jgi:sugar lactone lactonase YvrE
MGAAYDVTVQAQPVGLTCTVANGSGTMGSTMVLNVAVSCTATAVFTVSNFVGSGTQGMANGTGAAASFRTPTGLAFDRDGNLYVADTDNNVIRKVTPAGVVTTFAGTGVAGTVNGAASVAKFYRPRDLAFDSAGNMYVADYGSHLIRKITPAGDVSTFAGGVQGHVDGTGSAAAFNHPCGVAVDSNGNVFVSDRDNARIRKITPAGVVTTVAGTTGGAISGPQGIAVDANGTLFVADTFAHAVKSVSPAGVVTTLVQLFGGFPGSSPWGLVLDSTGNIYYTDSGQKQVRRLSPTGLVTNIAGTGASGSTNGAGNVATFTGPTGIAMDGAGNLLVSETNTGLIRKITR